MHSRTVRAGASRMIVPGILRPWNTEFRVHAKAHTRILYIHTLVRIQTGRTMDKVRFMNALMRV